MGSPSIRVTPRGLLCFDLDGPLLDVSERYWQVHVVAAGLKCPAEHARGRYLALKRDRCTDELICRVLDLPVAVERYTRLRTEMLEEPAYLEFDRVWSWTVPVLGILRSSFRIAIVTMRRNAANLRTQLATAGLGGLADAVLCRGDVPGDTTLNKTDLLRRAIENIEGPAVAVIGDTEEDVDAARALGLRAIAVTCGLRSPERLRESAPDELLPDISQLVASLQGTARQS